MDDTTARLVAFAQNQAFDALDAATVQVCKQRLIDTFACALGAFDEPLCQQARIVARRQRGTPEATIWGSTLVTTPEMAAFANGVMLRYLDLNDTYISLNRGHPSDMIAGIVAAAESLHSDGRSVIGAITLAYDVYCSFMDAVDINSRGWDQPVYGVMGCVMGIGRLMLLTPEQMGHALALALAPNMALTQTRRGHLSTWKGCAGANASRNAMFAATLAQEGFTGPTAVFEGEGGLWDVVGRFEWPLPDVPRVPHMIARTHLKSLAICYHGQSAVLCALDIRPRVSLRTIRSIEVATYRTAVRMMGSDAHHWAPRTRETADHSLPYVVAVALLDGTVGRASFSSARLTDPAVSALMAKVTVVEDPALSAQYPDAAPSRVVVGLESGESISAEVLYPAGHARCPMSEAQVEQKFRECFVYGADERCVERVLKSLQRFEYAHDVGRDVLSTFALRTADA